MDDYWKTFWPLICEKLEEIPLLKSWSGFGFYKPGALQKVTELSLSKDGNPLLPDLDGAEVYLSPKYTDGDLQTLRRLGTINLSWEAILDRLDADLHNTSGSNWKQMEKNADWRTRICRLLSRLACIRAETYTNFQQAYTELQRRLRSLPLTPLRDGTWLSSDSGTEVYFPYSNDIIIPCDLGIKLVHPLAVENMALTDFLTSLGAKSCPIEAVISSINKRYAATTFENFSLSNAVAHVRYLFWFVPKDAWVASKVRLANQHGSLVKEGQYLYFPDEDDEYSPSRLFAQDGEISGLPVHYLHADYMEAVDPGLIHNGRSWKNWLADVGGVHRLPVLQAKDPCKLSNEFHYIINHRSDRLLEVMKRGQTHYDLFWGDRLKAKVLCGQVALENGSKKSLFDIFLPFPKLKQIAAELSLAEDFPFIAMFGPLQDDRNSEWAFLKDLKIKYEENLYFYLAALNTIKDDVTEEKKDKLTTIYQNIQSRCIEDQGCVAVNFQNDNIWIPPLIRVNSDWVSSFECVWDGPTWLKSRQRLKSDYYKDLEHLFKVSLKISNASQRHVVSDLRMLKGHCENEVSSRSAGTARASSKVETDPDTRNSEKRQIRHKVYTEQIGNGPKDHFQSVTSMREYRGLSFEVKNNILSKGFLTDHRSKELRLADYSEARRPSSINSLSSDFDPFAGFGIDEITEEVEHRYEYLSRKDTFQEDEEGIESRKVLRFSFENDALVYNPKENTWIPPSQCVWVDSSVKIPGKASIANVYPLKKMFFTKLLQVSEPTVEMYVESLKAGARGNPPAAHIKATMALICGLGFEEGALSSLVDSKILPVRLANNDRSASVSFQSALDEFTVLDNTIHQGAFQGKIAALDFTLEEIRDTRPLLMAMGLEKKLSSKLAQEVTNVERGQLDPEMTKKFRAKSQAMTRCAVHFASRHNKQDPRLLYRKCKRAKVHVTEGIRLSMSIKQNGRHVEGATSWANFHLEEKEGGLRSYLPKDEADREVCFESDLPRRLCQFLHITDPGAPGIIGGVFRQNNLAVIDRILEKAGIGQVDCDFAALNEDPDTSDGDVGFKSLAEGTSKLRFPSPSPASRSHTPPGRASWKEKQSGTVHAQAIGASRTPSPPHQEIQKDISESAYESILENVVNTARQRAGSGVLEPTESFVAGSMVIEPLAQEIIQDAFAARTQERDFKVGAAGELFMFEFLKGLYLEGFSLINWKSSIRDRVKGHPDYRDLEKSNDRHAIADIVYFDSLSKLTRFLVEKGHLAREIWEDKKPCYHIEVKATISSSWQEPFFMSKAQEKHIRDYAIGEGTGSLNLNIYLICRIFNLGNGDETGVHIYLDPETQRRNGQLEFSTHTWAVKPLLHPSMPTPNDAARGSAAQTKETNPISAEASGGRRHDVQRQPAASSSDKSRPLTGSNPEPQINIEELKSKNTPTSQPLPSFSPRTSNQVLSARAANANNTFNFATTSASSFEIPKPKHPAGGLFGSSPVTFGNNGSTQSNSVESKPKYPTGGFCGSSAASSGNNESSQSTPVTSPFTEPNTTASSGKTSSSNLSTPLAQTQGSVFGSNPTPPQSGGLFGSNPKSNSSSSKFGGGKSSPSSKNLFSSNATIPTSDSLFGENSGKNNNGGSFGATTASPDTGNPFSSINRLFGSGTTPASNTGSSNPLSQSAFGSTTKFGAFGFADANTSETQSTGPSSKSGFGGFGTSQTTSSDKSHGSSTSSAPASSTSSSNPLSQSAFGSTPKFGAFGFADANTSETRSTGPSNQTKFGRGQSASSDKTDGSEASSSDNPSAAKADSATTDGCKAS